MKAIGYIGGGELIRLGSFELVDSFFQCAYKLASDSSEITYFIDRLYKRFVKFEDLGSTEDVMKALWGSFEAAKVDDFYEELSNGNIGVEVRFNDGRFLSEIYSKFFSGFYEVAEAAKYFYDDWGVYSRVFIGVVDVPRYELYERIPDSVLDEISGMPVWLRDGKGEDVAELKPNK